jgi:hypothetical protein
MLRYSVSSQGDSSTRNSLYEEETTLRGNPPGARQHIMRYSASSQGDNSTRNSLHEKKKTIRGSPPGSATTIDALFGQLTRRQLNEEFTIRGGDNSTRKPTGMRANKLCVIRPAHKENILRGIHYARRIQLYEEAHREARQQTMRYSASSQGHNSTRNSLHEEEKALRGNTPGARQQLMRYSASSQGDSSTRNSLCEEEKALRGSPPGGAPTHYALFRQLTRRQLYKEFTIRGGEHTQMEINKTIGQISKS